MASALSQGDFAALLPHGLTRIQWDRMVAAGILEPEDRVELIRGVMSNMSPQGALHASVVSRVGERLTQALRGRATVRQHSPIAITSDSEPEPDIAIVPTGDYSRAHPKTALLIVEVADTSIIKDRSVKAKLYAEAGIAEYWLVDLEGRAVEVYRRPSATGYEEVAKRTGNDVVTVQAFSDISLRVDEVWG